MGMDVSVFFCEHCSIYYKENDGIHRCRNRRTWCGTCTRLITNKDRNCLFCNFSSNIDLCCPGCGGVIDDICGKQLCLNCPDTVLVGGKDPNYDLDNYEIIKNYKIGIQEGVVDIFFEPSYNYDLAFPHEY